MNARKKLQQDLLNIAKIGNKGSSSEQQKVFNSSDKSKEIYESAKKLASY